MTAPRSVSTSSRALTNWFGKSALSSFANIAFSLTVPVVGSIWLSIVEQRAGRELRLAGRGRRRRPPGCCPARTCCSTAGRLSSRDGEHHGDRLELR